MTAEDAGGEEKLTLGGISVIFLGKGGESALIEPCRDGVMNVSSFDGVRVDVSFVSFTQRPI
jgi:hypothetical protein